MPATKANANPELRRVADFSGIYVFMDYINAKEEKKSKDNDAWYASR